jgi:hypothetical protein
MCEKARSDGRREIGTECAVAIAMDDGRFTDACGSQNNDLQVNAWRIGHRNAGSEPSADEAGQGYGLIWKII